MTIDDAKDWLRDHAGKVMVGVTGGLLAISLLALGSAALDDGTAGAETRAVQMKAGLEEDAEAAEASLETAHAKLLADLPGIDAERVKRDQASGRSVLLSLTDASASSRDLKGAQLELDARYDFLDTSSRALTEFLPEWLATTGGGKGQGTAYALGSIEIDPSGVQALDYSYVGLARLNPVSTDGKTATAKPEFVAFQYTTEQGGTVTGFEASRLSSRSRDALLAAEEKPEASEGSTGTAPAPSTTPEPTQSSGG